MTSSSLSAAHQFLEVGRYHRNARDADALVMALLRPCFPRLSKNQIRKQSFTFGSGEKQFKRTYDSLKREARETGTVRVVWHYLRGEDPFFPMTVDVATDSSGIAIKSRYAGHEVKFTGPMRVAAIEHELCNDILHYRRAGCEASRDSGFEETTRYYRAYVLSCTSLIEAFLNRPVMLYAHLREHIDAIEALHKPMNFDARVELWVNCFCGDSLRDLKKTAAWSQVQELRQERNRLVHATEPQLGVEIKRLAYGFNLVREGVGGFMRKLRDMQDLSPTPFIESLESAPRVTFRPKRERVRRR